MLLEPLRPHNAVQVAEAVAWSVSEAKPLEIVGHGTRRRIGRAAQYGATLDLAAITGITLYEPEELVLSARAGTPMAEIEAALAGHSQELAFEPPDLSRLLGGDRDAGTIGGAIACNFAGPRRIKAGAARDHFLGFTAVSGRGEIFKSGGRVVKNVTGYDLCKLLAGSWGTLAVMSDITVKVLPAAETETTILVAPGVAGRAVEAMAGAMQSPCEVSGACHLPQEVARAASVAGQLAAAGGVTALRLEGIAASVDYRAEKLAALVKPFGEVARLGRDPSRTLWREVRDVSFFEQGGERPVWRISVPPSAGAAVYERIASETGARGFLDWAGGLVWLEMPPAADAWAALVRAAVAASGGHATLVRAPETIRSSVDVFQPQAPGLARLSRRLKAGFDPEGILNPGRMQAEG